MVNPGVIFLAQNKIYKENFSVEDNIGESIHVHWGHMRLDFTIREFIAFAEQFADAMNLMVGKKNFDIREEDIDYFYHHADLLINISSNEEESAANEIKAACKNRADEILNCMEITIPQHLKKKSVVLKGAGEHTRELIKLWKDKVNIVGILSNDMAKIEGYAALEYEQLKDLGVDAIVISSYRYRKEMMAELKENTENMEIIDLYHYLEYLGVRKMDREYYKYI